MLSSSISISPINSIARFNSGISGCCEAHIFILAMFAFSPASSIHFDARCNLISVGLILFCICSIPSFLRTSIRDGNRRAQTPPTRPLLSIRGALPRSIQDALCMFQRRRRHTNGNACRFRQSRCAFRTTSMCAFSSLRAFLFAMMRSFQSLLCRLNRNVEVVAVGYADNQIHVSLCGVK